MLRRADTYRLPVRHLKNAPETAIEQRRVLHVWQAGMDQRYRADIPEKLQFGVWLVWPKAPDGCSHQTLLGRIQQAHPETFQDLSERSHQRDSECAGQKYPGHIAQIDWQHRTGTETSSSPGRASWEPQPHRPTITTCTSRRRPTTPTLELAPLANPLLYKKNPVLACGNTMEYGRSRILSIPAPRTAGTDGPHPSLVILSHLLLHVL